MTQKIAIIAGAGPAGLTAALELLRHSDVKPVVFEQDTQVGGISKTINHQGNRMDIGGHRFFSKSDWVMDWWQQILPVESNNDHLTLTFQNKQTHLQVTSSTDNTEQVMLVRNRLSRIFFEGNFFDYPVKLNPLTVKNLGVLRMIKMGISYITAMLRPIKKESSLEDFLINRFGKELYLTFFKSYTEKVWGTSCKNISAEWGAQRIKGLSITRALLHAVKQVFQSNRSLQQKETETSLVEYFLYPKLGPGQMWEQVAKQVCQKGGEVKLQYKVEQVILSHHQVSSVVVRNLQTNELETLDCDYFFSTMPIKELINNIQPKPPEQVFQLAKKLEYRDFITIGLLIPKVAIAHEIQDNWIYIQDKGVHLGRVQVFNNWSPYLVKDDEYYWLGLDIFVMKVINYGRCLTMI